MAVEMLAILPGILLLFLANYTEKRKDLQVITKVFLGLIVALVLLMGLAMAVMPEVGGMKTSTYGYSITVSAAVSFLIFLRPLRKWISGIINIDADNWLHATALVFAILLVGMSLGTAISVDIVSFTQDSGISGSTVLIQDVLLVLGSLVGVGWLSRREWRAVLKRLGLVKPSLKDLMWTGIFTVILFAVVIVIGFISLAVNPDSQAMELKDDPTVQILGSISIISAIAFALGAGIGEEILFRGAIQPRFGIAFTSIIFAIMHIQYPDFFSLLTLFLISIILGIERQMINTTAAVISHAVYDLVLLLAVAVAI
jgi:hypothetical protein